MIASERLATRQGAALAGSLIVFVFLALRIAIFFARDPYFDELFTLWMAHQPFSGIVPALKFDSGPPLYYMVARFHSIAALRCLSLVFSTATLAAILLRSSLGPMRFLAGLLLAVYPPAIVYAVEARSYAMCAFFIALAVLALDSDRPFAAAILLVIAAYTHFYGVLFFPVLLVKRWRGFAAAALAGALFIPGFLLALTQPRAALAWNSAQPLLGPITNLSFAGAYAAAILLAPPVWLIGVAFIVLVVAVSRDFRFAAAVLIPALLAVAFTAFGRIVYFPLRFESVLAAPLMLWLAGSLLRWPVRVRAALAAGLIVIGLAVISKGLVGYLERPLDPCREAALLVRSRISPSTPIYASRYCYLEAVTWIGPNVRAFPAEQARHPGWSAPPAGRPTLNRDLLALSELSTPSVWIGDIRSPELAAIRSTFRFRPLITLPEGIVVGEVGMPLRPML